MLNYNILEIICANKLTLWGKIIEILKRTPEIYSIWCGQLYIDIRIPMLNTASANDEKKFSRRMLWSNRKEML